MKLSAIFVSILVAAILGIAVDARAPVKKIRKAKHAGRGKMYYDDPYLLNQELTEYLGRAKTYIPKYEGKLKVLIGPHAAIPFSGPTAAKAYKNMAARALDIDRVVLFGPSHFAPLDRIGTTHADEFETPLGNIVIDKEV